MKKIFAFALGLVLFASACTDPELDPLQFDKIVKGSMITLRGKAVDNLNDRSFRGAIAKLSKSADPATAKFEFETDFVADNLDNLGQVEVFARATDSAPRVKVATVEGSAFRVPSGSVYPRATISIPFSAILTATGVKLADAEENSYLYIECDLTLKDGVKVSASSIVNSSLFESARFYPAHSLRALIVK